MKPLAEPAMKTIAAMERLIDTGCRVNSDNAKENKPVVIQVMKNQLLASGALTPHLCQHTDLDGQAHKDVGQKDRCTGRD